MRRSTTGCSVQNRDAVNVTSASLGSLSLAPSFKATALCLWITVSSFGAALRQRGHRPSQAAVPVEDVDTADTLAARILVEEHRIYPAAIGIVLDGGWRIDGRRFVRS